MPPEIHRLDPWQQDVLTSSHPENHVLVHRQGGKSRIIAVKANIVALTEPGSLILNISRSYRQSLELARKIRESLNLYRESLQRERVDVTVDLGLLTDAKSEFELSNGSRIVSLPPNEETIRGYSKPRLVILDEASRIPDPVYLCLRPMALMSPKWEMWLISTPFGQRGFFWQESRNPDFKTYKHTILDAVKLNRVNNGFVEGEKKKGDLYFRQEFNCEFLSNMQSLFSRPELEAALTKEQALEGLYDVFSRT